MDRRTWTLNTGFEQRIGDLYDPRLLSARDGDYLIIKDSAPFTGQMDYCYCLFLLFFIWDLFYLLFKLAVYFCLITET